MIKSKKNKHNNYGQNSAFHLPQLYFPKVLNYNNLGRSSDLLHL